MSVKLVLTVRLSLTVSKYPCTKVDRTGLKKHSRRRSACAEPQAHVWPSLRWQIRRSQTAYERKYGMLLRDPRLKRRVVEAISSHNLTSVW